MTHKQHIALLIAVLALGGIGWQFLINGITTHAWGQRIWQMALYFTNITNLLLGLVMAQIAIGRKGTNTVTTTLTPSMIMVGLIYRLLLAPDVPKPSPEWYPDFFVHVATPILMALWWLVRGQRICV